MSAIRLPSDGSRPAAAAVDVGWMPCSDASLLRADPLEGTSGRGERWFLIEVDGAWGAHALLQSRLPPTLARTLVGRIEAAGMRPLAIRRTGRRADERRAQSRWRWAVVDARPGHESVRWGEVGDPGDLLDVPLDGSSGEASDEPVICVCAHARHDQCCAVRGRPVVAALAQEYPEATWECSHLGGDRFAATMIVFPHALQFGRVTAAAAVGVLERYAEGRIARPFFRGRASLPNLVQAAESFARDHVDDDRIDAFRLVDSHTGDAGWSVRFEHMSEPEGESALSAGERASEPVEVSVGERMSAPMLTTCSSTVAMAVREYVDLGVRVPHRTP